MAGEQCLSSPNDPSNLTALSPELVQLTQTCIQLSLIRPVARVSYGGCECVPSNRNNEHHKCKLPETLKNKAF